MERRHGRTASTNLWDSARGTELSANVEALIKASSLDGGTGNAAPKISADPKSGEARWQTTRGRIEGLTRER